MQKDDKWGGEEALQRQVLSITTIIIILLLCVINCATDKSWVESDADFHQVEKMKLI